MQKKNALMVTTVARTARAFLQPYVAALNEVGWTVHLATAPEPLAPMNWEGFAKVIDVPWGRSIFAIPQLLAAWWSMRRLLLNGRYDIVHVHTPIAAAITRFACVGIPRKTRPQVVYTAHGFHFHRNGKRLKNEVFALCERLAGYWTDVLIVINRDDEREANRRKLVPRGKVFHVPGIGLDCKKYSEARRDIEMISAWRVRHDLPPDAIVVSMIAEFNPGKRHADAVRALALCKHKNAHLVFAGAGRCLEQVKTLARGLGVLDRCRFLGFCNAIPSLLAASKVAILPSEREGLPRAVMEAMAMMVPVVGANSRGIRDLLYPDCGLIHSVGDVVGLAKCIDQILESEELRDNLRKNAARRILHYDIHSLVRWHLKLYEALRVGRNAAKLVLPSFQGISP